VVHHSNDIPGRTEIPDETVSPYGAQQFRFFNEVTTASDQYKESFKSLWREVNRPTFPQEQALHGVDLESAELIQVSTLRCHGSSNIFLRNYLYLLKDNPPPLSYTHFK